MVGRGKKDPDRLSKKITNDLFSIIKNTTFDQIQEKSYERLKYILPDENGFIEYELNTTEFSIDFFVERRNPKLSNYQHETKYYLHGSSFHWFNSDDANNEDEVCSSEPKSEIVIFLELNPIKEPTIYEELYFDLLFTNRHEIEHVIQHQNDPFRFEKEEPDGVDYYLQQVEIEANAAGLYLVSKKQNLPFLMVANNYFSKVEEWNQAITSKAKEKIVQEVTKFANTRYNLCQKY